jgi:hypothetical protein
MARLKSIGLELNSTSVSNGGIEISTSTGSAFSIQTGVVRTGTYALKITGLSSGTASGVAYNHDSGGASGPNFYRTYFRPETLPSAEQRIIALIGFASYNLGSTVAYITIDNTGVLRLYDEDGVIGSASAALTLNTWNSIEIYFDKATGGPGSHIVKARLNGVEFASASNRNLAQSTLGFWVGGNLGGEAQTQGVWYFDDLAINSNIGSFQNSYPGEGMITRFKPNADGDNHAWATAGPVAGTANNYTNVDEVTPNDATDSVESSANGSRDSYNMEDTTATIGASDTINVVHVEVRYVSEGAGTGDSFALQIKGSASGTIEESANITPSGTSWTTNGNSAPRTPPLTLYDMPGASTTPWTKSDLDNMQAGIHQVDASGSFTTDVTAVWVTVDSTPAAGGATPSPALPTASNNANAPVNSLSLMGAGL